MKAILPLGLIASVKCQRKTTVPVPIKATLEVAVPWLTTNFYFFFMQQSETLRYNF